MKKDIEMVGFIAMLFSVVSFFPGAYEVWIRYPQPARAVSLPMYVIFNIGVVLWLVYGLRKNIWTIWLTNLIIALPAFSVLVYKLIYG